ncbi:MAG: hypothetical protein KH372_02735 [Olsenella uli]|uniref:hypothetical protein n=1 Tax=Olsenella uli TaxID=133926 RepID=UPI001D1DE983|nr:hypothetical protein [Olsenella uli]MBS6417727.1 hypothetical protein [Olsenella uli]
MGVWVSKGDLGGAISSDMGSISRALDSASGQIGRLGGAIPDGLRGEAYDADRRFVENVCLPALKAQYVALQGLYDGDQSNSGGVSALPDDPSPLDSDDLSDKIRSLDNSIAALEEQQARVSRARPGLGPALEGRSGTGLGPVGPSSWGLAGLEGQLSALREARGRLAEALQALADYDSASSSYYSDAGSAVADALSQSCRQMAGVRETGEVPSGYPSWAAGLDDLYGRAFASRVEDIKNSIWDGSSVNTDRLTELYDSEALTAEQQAALDRAYAEVGSRAMQGDTSQLEAFLSCGYAATVTGRTDPDQNGMYSETVTYSLRPGARAMLGRWSKDEGLNDAISRLPAGDQFGSVDEGNLLGFLDGAAMACALNSSYGVQFLAVSATSGQGRMIGSGYSPDVTPGVLLSLDAATTADGQAFHVLNMEFGGGAQYGHSLVTGPAATEHVTFENSGEANASNMGSYLGKAYQKDPSREAVSAAAEGLVEGLAGGSPEGAPAKIVKGLGHVGAAAALDGAIAGGKEYLEVVEDNKTIAALGNTADVGTYARLHFRHTGGVVTGDDGVAALAGTATAEERAAYDRAMEAYGRTGGAPDGFMEWLDDKLPKGSMVRNQDGALVTLDRPATRHTVYGLGWTVGE